MAIPIGALIGAIGSSASGGGSGQKYAGGIGKNLLGAPGDPGGTAMDLFLGAKERKEDKRRYEEQKKMQEDALRQQGINSLFNRQSSGRDQNMNAINMLASQRQNAIDTLGRQKLKNSFFKG